MIEGCRAASRDESIRAFPASQGNPETYRFLLATCSYLQLVGGLREGGRKRSEDEFAWLMR